MQAEAHYTLNDVWFYRGQRAIMQGINLAIPKGKITAIMGPSGTGKTTLLKLMTRQERVSQGEVVFENQSVNRMSAKALLAMRKKTGYLFQSGALLTDLSVFENVAYPLREHTHLSEEMIRKLVLMKLHAVGLRGAAFLKPSELSGGMARRVALARAIALDPEVILYDEPFTGQDPISMGVLMKLIKQLNQAMGLTSVVVSHDVDEVLSIADYACVISGGVVVAEGTPAELRAHESAWVRQFLEGHADGPVPFHFPADDYAADLQKVTG
jgi:phospholipid/cholesterol/gamma-HCH transport system ATP-binding protein